MGLFERGGGAGKTEHVGSDKTVNREGAWPSTEEFRELDLRSGREQELNQAIKYLEYAMSHDLIPALRRAVVDGDFGAVKEIVGKISNQVDHKEKQFGAHWKDLGPDSGNDQTVKRNEYLDDWRKGKI